MLVFQSIVLLSAMSVCAVCLGTTGVILGMAIGPPLSYPFLVWCVRRYGVWLPWLDLVALGCTAAVCGVAYAV